MPEPYIVFVPGSYNPVSEYQAIIDSVSDAGYEVVGVDLPTVGPRSREGRKAPAPSMYEDAAAIATTVEKLADAGRDVAIVGHSYAGVPMSQSTKGLDKTARRAQGKPGGVVNLAYLSALVPPLGGSAASLLGRFPDEKRPAVSIDENGWMLMGDPAGTAAMVCQDLDPSEGKAVVERFAKHSAQSFANELTHAGYVDVPASWLLTLNDNAGPPEFQRDMIAAIEQASGRKVDVTEVASGHMANLTAGEEVARWIVEVARSVEQRWESYNG